MSVTSPLIFSMSSNIFFSTVLVRGAHDWGAHLAIGLKHADSAVAKQFGFEDVAAVEGEVVVEIDDEVEVGFKDDVDDEGWEDKGIEDASAAKGVMSICHTDSCLLIWP